MPLLSLDAVRGRLLGTGRWAVLLCLFSIPINKPATNIFIFLAMICALLGAKTRERLQNAARQPIVIGALVWLLVLECSALHAPAGMGRWQALGSAIALLYPFIVASLLENQQWRTRGMLAFAAGAGIVLILSWGQFFGIVPQRAIVTFTPSFRNTVFKDYTQQGIACLAFAAMAASFARTELIYKRKIMLWVCAALALINVMFLLQSRTSYLIIAPLLLFWVWRLAGGQHASWRRLGLGAMILFAGGAVAVMTPSVQHRLLQAKQDVTLYSSKREATSMGIRLELWKRTVPIIASAPLLGHGLGQWDVEYQAEVKDFKDYDDFKMHHPHQEALLIMAEEGMVGFAIFVILLIALGRHIRHLPQPQRDFYISLLLIYIAAGLANCLFADFSHRHVFIMLLACIPFVTKPKTPQAVAVS